METFWKRTVSADESPETLHEIMFSQDFHTGKLSEITVFYAVKYSVKYIRILCSKIRKSVNFDILMFQFTVV